MTTGIQNGIQNGIRNSETRATPAMINPATSVAMDPTMDPAMDSSSKAFGNRSTNLVLPVIDEIRPSGDLSPKEEDGVGEKVLFSSAGPASPCRKKCMKDRLRGLKDKYVSCLQAIDGAGDMRGFASSGGAPIQAPTGAHPFDSAGTGASISTAPVAN